MFRSTMHLPHLGSPSREYFITSPAQVIGYGCKILDRSLWRDSVTGQPRPKGR